MSGTTRRSAKQLLKDSGRYLLAGVRAALAEQVDATRETLDAWKAGSKELQKEPYSILRLVSDAMAEVTVMCAQLGVDLLHEPPEDALSDIPLDAPRMAAVMETMLNAAMKEFGQNTTIRVRITVRDWRIAVEAVANRPEAHERLMARLADAEQDLFVAAEIATAHGGQLTIKGDADTAALFLALPLG